MASSIGMTQQSRYTRRFTQLCNVEGVDASGDRSTVAENLLCSFPYPADKDARERANMGTNERLLQIYIEPQNGLASGQRLTVNSVEYGIHAVTAWKTSFCEVLIKTP